MNIALLIGLGVGLVALGASIYYVIHLNKIFQSESKLAVKEYREELLEKISKENKNNQDVTIHSLTN